MSDAPQMPNPPQIYLSYSLEDEGFVRQFKTVMEPYVLRNHWTYWDQEQIDFGDDEQLEIGKAVNRSRLAILFVSADYLADPIVRDEYRQILGSHSQDRLRIIPLLVNEVGEWPPEIANLRRINRRKSVAAMSAPERAAFCAQAARDIDRLVTTPIRATAGNTPAMPPDATVSSAGLEEPSVTVTTPSSGRSQRDRDLRPAIIILFAGVLGALLPFAAHNSAANPSQGDKQTGTPGPKGQSNVPNANQVKSDPSIAPTDPLIGFYPDTLDSYVQQAIKIFRRDPQSSPFRLEAKSMRLTFRQFLSLGEKLVPGPRGAGYYASVPPLPLEITEEYWVSKLKKDWNKFYPNRPDAIVASSTPLFETRLVLIMRFAQYTHFQDLLKRSEYSVSGQPYHKTWKLLHDLAQTEKWQVGIANPTTAHSTIGALALMFAEYRLDHPQGKTNDDEFEKYLRELAPHVSRGLDYSSTGQMVQDFISKKFINEKFPQPEVVIGYEANIMQVLAQEPRSNLYVVYPEPTLVVRLVGVTMHGSNDQNTATAFIQHLQEEPQQRLALAHGLRPVKLLSETEKTFADHNANGISYDPLAQPIMGDDATLDDLPYRWWQIYTKAGASSSTQQMKPVRPSTGAAHVR